MLTDTMSLHHKFMDAIYAKDFELAEEIRCAMLIVEAHNDRVWAAEDRIDAAQHTDEYARDAYISLRIHEAEKAGETWDYASLCMDHILTESIEATEKLAEERAEKAYEDRVSQIVDVCDEDICPVCGSGANVSCDCMELDPNFKPDEAPF